MNLLQCWPCRRTVVSGGLATAATRRPHCRYSGREANASSSTAMRCIRTGERRGCTQGSRTASGMRSVADARSGDALVSRLLRSQGVTDLAEKAAHSWAVEITHAAAQRNLFGRLLGCLHHCPDAGD